MAKPSYVPSRLSPGDSEILRQHSFTRWMSVDLLQPATDFLKNLGLLAIYAECTPENLHRYLCWQPAKGWGCEVRSGRTLDKFLEFDLGNIERGWPLLSLHINERDIYSAVWISPSHYEAARAYLAVYGIEPADRPQAT